MGRMLLGLAALAMIASCGSKNPKTKASVEGWQGKADWPARCWYPPSFGSLGPGDRKLARQKTLKAMMSQWSGHADDVVSFDSDDVTDIETVLLGQPDLIEQVAVENLGKCESAMNAAGDTLGWAKWLRDAPGRLTEGQCKSAPLDYQLFDYLDIARGWQIPASVCLDDMVRIRASSMDMYQIEKGGKWINAAGDPDKPALGTQLPCNFEGCFQGQLIMRFTGYSGTQQIIPVGLEYTFDPPEHGKIEVMINDDTMYDNKFKVEGTIGHHTSIEYAGQ